MTTTGGAPRARRDAAKRTVVIGITGPIGCGKSTVAGWLAELGAAVIDADVIAREVVEQGSPALDVQIAREFGPEIMQADGSLDRAALGRTVFADPTALARLERIVHPAVRPRILRVIAAAKGVGAPAVVVEAIKLVEGGLAELCDEVWLVTCDPADQRERLERRGVIVADAAQRIAAQGDIAQRLTQSATRVIHTSGAVEAVHARVRDLWRSEFGASAADATGSNDLGAAND